MNKLSLYLLCAFACISLNAMESQPESTAADLATEAAILKRSLTATEDTTEYCDGEKCGCKPPKKDIDGSTDEQSEEATDKCPCGKPKPKKTIEETTEAA